MDNYVGTGAHLIPAGLRAWTSLLDTMRILETELAHELGRDFQMTHREYEVLVRIDGAGGQERLSVLARKIEASAALVSQTVTRLEARGWLRREQSATDRRGVHAVLTNAGHEALATAARPHAETIQRLLLDPMHADLDIVAQTLGDVADHLRAHRATGSCDDPGCRLPTESTPTDA